ncbi:hypothetical protein [Stenomitos frigidus]|nr:hypothetical protein [Stenomitos frigidus]
MKRSNGQSLNGRGFTVLEPAPIEPIQTTDALKVLTPIEAGGRRIKA